MAECKHQGNETNTRRNLQSAQSVRYSKAW